MSDSTNSFGQAVKEPVKESELNSMFGSGTPTPTPATTEVVEADKKDEPQAQEPQATPEVEVDVESDGAAEADYPNNSTTNGGEFRWPDIQRAAEFTRVFMEKPRKFRDWLRWTLDMSGDASALDLIRRLHDHDDSIWGIRQVNDLLVRVQSTDIMDIVRLATSLTELEHPARKQLMSGVQQIVNFFPLDKSEDRVDVTLRYRRNLDDNAFVETIISNIKAIDAKAAQERLAEAEQLFAVWG